MALLDGFLDESHVQLKKNARRFAEAEIRPHAHDWEEAGLYPRELHRKAAEAGLLGVGLPEEVGGAGGGALHMVVAIEGLMHGQSTGVTVGLGSLGIALPPLVQWKDAWQIDTFVRPVLAGEQIAALAITEPGTGSDVAGVSTRAVKDGEDWVIDGAKLFITSGTRADVLTVLARTGEDPHGGLSFFVLQPTMPGVKVSRALKKTGWWASDTAELAFDGVRVPDRHRVGPIGAGFVTLMRNFVTERLALAAYGAVTAELAVAEATAYARQRKAFGRPIAGFQVTRHKLADMMTRTMAAKTLVYQVARRFDAGDPCVQEAAMAKNLAAETAVAVTYDAVQILGGMGYMRESFVERLSRDARLLPIGGGTQEIMKELIAKGMGL
jgi:acyl-CoA dehydrogenase